MLAATEYSLTNRRSFGRADSTLSRASPVAQYQNSVPREREGGNNARFDKFDQQPTPTRRTVLQIKPACTPLIEQNFDTGLTRNSAPRVTKHRVNMIVLSSPTLPLYVLWYSKGGEGVMYFWICKNIKSILLTSTKSTNQRIFLFLFYFLDSRRKDCNERLEFFSKSMVILRFQNWTKPLLIRHDDFSNTRNQNPVESIQFQTTILVKV